MSNFHRIAFAVSALALCASVGCSKPSSSSASASGPWTPASKHIEVSRFGVNAPRADGRACWTASYSVDLQDKTLHVDTCLDDDPISRDVTLSAADVRRIESSLAALRDGASKSKDCDASSTFLVQIYDEPRKLSHFIDSGNACHAGDMGTLERGSLEGLFATLAAIDSSGRS